MAKCRSASVADESISRVASYGPRAWIPETSLTLSVQIAAPWEVTVPRFLPVRFIDRFTVRVHARSRSTVFRRGEAPESVRHGLLPLTNRHWCCDSCTSSVSLQPSDPADIACNAAEGGIAGPELKSRNACFRRYRTAECSAIRIASVATTCSGCRSDPQWTGREEPSEAQLARARLSI